MGTNHCRYYCFILVLAGIAIGFFTENKIVWLVAMIATAVAVVARIALMIYRGRTLPNYNRLLRQERYSNGTFLALQNANSRKTPLYIWQSCNLESNQLLS